MLEVGKIYGLSVVTNNCYSITCEESGCHVKLLQLINYNDCVVEIVKHCDSEYLGKHYTIKTFELVELEA